MKLLIVGFDGLDYRLFTHADPSWFSEFQEGSNYGIANPEYSSAITSWASILTGLKAETHGITGLPSRSKSMAERSYIWDYLNDAGLTCGVMNFPATWPAPKIKGWFVSGGQQELSYTPEIIKPLLDGYIPDYRNLGKTGRNLAEVGEKLLEIMKIKLHILIGLPSVDCLLIQFPLIDRIGHETLGVEDRKDCYDQMGEMMTSSEWAAQVLVERHEPEFLALVSDHGWQVDVPNQSVGSVHSGQGVWLIGGPTVTEGVRTDIMNYDFLPSLLEAMGLPVPEDLDGRSRIILKEGVLASKWAHIERLVPESPILLGAEGIWQDSDRCRGFAEEEDRTIHINTLKKIMDGIKFKTVLDLGCGPGLMCEPLDWEECWAVDQSELMLDLLRERMGDRDGLHIRQEWIQDYQQEAPVDLVMCLGVFQHATDPKSLFGYLSSLDAKYLVIDFLEWQGEWRLDLPLPHERDACSKILPSREVDAIIQNTQVLRRIDLQSEHAGYSYRILLLRGNESLHTAKVQAQ